uniref:HD domain-containing protein n=1 Tax=viral metagenome TaxID=1070528 RepID=A0A6M3JJM4_9ZZZZ
MNRWIETLTHKKVDIFDPDPDSICIEDIAHHLAIINRFVGATREPYSVAQHSVILASFFDDRFFDDRIESLQALMHDAAEYCINDIPSPIKQEFKMIKKVEDNFCKTIFNKFNIPFPWSFEIDRLDKCLGKEEGRQLGKNVDMWPNYTEEEIGKLPWDIDIIPWNWGQAEGAFLNSFKRLTE